MNKIEATNQPSPLMGRKLIFISMTDQANGAEYVLSMVARVTGSAIIFLKKAEKGALRFKYHQQRRYVTNRGMLAGFFGLIRLLKNYRRDYIIISTHAYLNAFLGFLKRIGYLRSKLIVRECTSVFTRYHGLKRLSYQMSYHLGYPAADLVVCQTELMKQQFSENIRFISPNKIIVQENPVDLEQTIENGSEIPEDPDLKTDYICSAGRLIPEKGFQALIRAFSLIAGQYPDLNLLILGDGPQKQSLLTQISAMGLDGRVKLKGWLENPHPFFRRARVCVVSSAKEGFPNVLLQMMALNQNVVSTLCAGGIESIPGILKVRVGDIDSLAKTLKIALHQDAAEEKKKMLSYLNKRRPEAFIHSVLQSLS